MTSGRSSTVSFDLLPALARMVELGASDLHLKAGNRPLIRVDGELIALDEDAATLTPSDTENALQGLLSSHLIAQFERGNELDFAHGVAGLGRFRVNAYRQRGTIALVVRAVARTVRTIDELRLPAAVRRLAEFDAGVVIISGTPASGKSTTIAAMLEHINTTMRKHVVTIEDPIEYLFKDKLASIDQREVGVDTASFGVALRQVVRQDPDVIFVGELRDAETVAAAFAAAQEGHLVLTTLQSSDVTDSIDRITELFEPDEQVNVRELLASVLKGIVSQRLVPTIKPGGSLAVTEVMTVTDRVRDALLHPRGTAEIPGILAHGELNGMHTFAQSLYQATQTGQISMRAALAHASHPHDLRLLAAADERPQVPAAESTQAEADPVELGVADVFAPVRASVPPPIRG